METETKQTPIEEILYEKPMLRSKALELCTGLGIQTAEQLATYNVPRLKRAINQKGLRKSGEGTLKYLSGCLERAGYKFAEETVQDHGKLNSFDIIGRDNVKEYLLETINQMTQPSSKSAIAYDTATKMYDKVVSHLNDYEDAEAYREEGIKPGIRHTLRNGVELFFRGAFHPRNTNPLLEELVTEGKIQKVIFDEGRTVRYVCKNWGQQ